MKDLNDGLYATLSVPVQQDAEFSLANEVASCTDQTDDLRTIQDVSGEHSQLLVTSAFKSLNIELQTSPTARNGVQPSLEIPFAQIHFDAAPHPDIAQRCLGSVARAGDITPVLIEWKYYQEEAASGSSRPTIIRMQRLARLLMQQPKPPHFRTLTSVGYTHDRFRSRLGLLLLIPTPKLESSAGLRSQASWASFSSHDKLNSTNKPLGISLYELIGLRPKLPLLEHRYALALALVKSMIQLHATGWYHKGFRSNNILFFDRIREEHNNGSGASAPNNGAHSQTRATSTAVYANITEPHIVGFELSRPSSNMEISDGLNILGQIAELYVHPTYLQNSPSTIQVESAVNDTTRFSADYDMYSLGCVLLEIGLWRRLTDIWKAEYTARGWNDWSRRLQELWVPELAGRCGSTYLKVVLDLLTRAAGGCALNDAPTEPPMTNMELVSGLENLKV